MINRLRIIIYYIFSSLIAILLILSIFSLLLTKNNNATIVTKNDKVAQNSNSNKKNESKYDYKKDLNYDKEGFSPIWPIDPYPPTTTYRGISAYYIDPVYKKIIGVNHYAVDIRAKNRTIILAIEDGHIIKVAKKRAQGWELVIKHLQGYTSLYGHLAKISVKVGDFVKQGEFVGLTGAGERGGGISTGPHLHFEIRKNNRRLDPLLFLDLTVLPQEALRSDYWKQRTKQILQKNRK